MDDMGEGDSGGGAALLDLTPTMLNSLVISPSKAHTSQALSPLRKRPITINQSAYIGDGAMTRGTEGNLNENSEFGVRSVAVVKSSEVEFPVQFHELQSNTDLKMPPSNWLQDHSSIRLPNPTHQHSDFSSFLMAHQFLDCIGEVDVISDAENIKKLLKIPYNPKAHVSMMIHRVGKTLLIDEFDIYKYLLRQSEKDWQWLRKFFFEHVLQSLTHKENVLVRPNKSRNVVHSRSLLSKFLYHSINEEEVPSPTTPTPPASGSPVSVHRASVVGTEVMPEPTLEDQLPRASGQAFTRNVVWNFEDLHMLIGTDLPIFGGGTHPCVSLRLRDMSKPINILTGIDYWLDNLMCNVPEVLMCYHLDGIVQKYELIKTEDLPHSSDSQFSPKLVRDVAQNILSFLNSKATKEGHTYWLFKGKDDDIVKLYDLTSLCVEGGIGVDGAMAGGRDQDTGNPFTVPVAMLFYRVAKNIRSSDEAHNKAATIRALLKNSLSLLNKNEYPKIVSSAHYMLSDLYLPQDTDPDSPDLSDCSEEDSEWSSPVTTDDDDSDDDQSHNQSVSLRDSSSTIKVSSLSHPNAAKTQSHHYKAPPLLGTLEERCHNAIHHVVEALRCLHASNTKDDPPRPSEPKYSRPQPEEEPKKARPFEPIPMPYSPLNANKDEGKALVVAGERANERTNEHQLTVSVLSQQYTVASWWDKLHVLLLRKASLVYLIMARTNFNAQKYGLALRCMRFSLHAWGGMARKLGMEDDVPMPCQALTLVGDVFYLLSKTWDEVASHIEEYNHISAVQQEMLMLLDNILPAQECRWSIKLPCNVEEALMMSSSNFEKAMSVADPQATMHLSRRLGNICNELGVLYMNQASKLFEENNIRFDAAEKLWQRSGEVLSRGIEHFEHVGDITNVALLHSNTGRLLRLCAFYCVAKDVPREFSKQERHYYEQAVKEYQRALEVLKSRKKGADIWDLVVWEFGTTLYTIASLLQDTPPKALEGSEEHAREVIELLNKALKQCDLKSGGVRQPLYQYRAAVIYMRLAGIYHTSLRQGRGDKKAMRHLADLNYSRAAALFLQLENPIDILKVQLDQVVLLEDQTTGNSNQQASMKLYLSILQLLHDSLPALKIIGQMSGRTTAASANQDGQKEAERSNANIEGMYEDEESLEKIQALLLVFEKKLQNSLMALIKLSSHGKGKKSIGSGGDVGLFKQMYSLSLNTQAVPLGQHLLATVQATTPLLAQVRLKR